MVTEAPAVMDANGNIVTPARLPVHTLSFEIPKNETFSGGRAQPHSEIRVDYGDVVKMVIPGYKPKSYSVSALREDEFDVTFKVYPGGRSSGYLNSIQVGECIHSFGMRKGNRRNPGAFVGIIAYGVGITEALPVAMAELEKKDAKQVVLLWAARTQADTFWKDEIVKLETKYPDSFRLQMIYSQDTQADAYQGRINPQVLSEVFEKACENKSEARFLSVGTKEMMRMTDGMLETLGFSMPKHALLPKKRS